MTVGTTYSVAASVGLDAEAGATVPPGSAPTTVVTLPSLRCTVAAELRGVDFEITPDQPVEQSFLGTRVLTWHWQVRPKRSGSGLTLELHLQWAEEQEGRALRRGPEQKYDAIIKVEAVGRSSPSRMWGWITDFFGHPLAQILGPGLAGALALWLARRFRRKESGAENRPYDRRTRKGP